MSFSDWKSLPPIAIRLRPRSRKLFHHPRDASLPETKYIIVVQISNPAVSAAPRLVMAEAQRFPELGALYRDVVLARVRRLITRICECGIAQGKFRDVNPEVLLRMCGGPVVAQMMLTTIFADPAQPGPAPETIATGIADMVLNGLKIKQDAAA